MYVILQKLDTRSQLALFVVPKRLSHFKTKWVIIDEFPILPFHVYISWIKKIRKGNDRRIDEMRKTSFQKCHDHVFLFS